MELYIGGYGQGKLAYVLAQKKGEKLQIADGANALDLLFEGEGIPVFCHLHLWCRRMLQEGREPEVFLQEMLEKHPNMILISDEIGNGIVPMEAFEREYRERLGRMLIMLAEKAERVERILCGLGQRLK